MNIKIKKLNDKATIPAYMSEGAAGMDLYSSTREIDVKNGNIVYNTGIAIELPPGFEAQVRPRSSLRNKDIILINSPGTIDSDYRGEIIVTFKPLRPGARIYEPGERVAQLVIVPVIRAEIEVVNELTETTRGTGAFGSTGK